jgi:hypothetical protein
MTLYGIKVVPPEWEDQMPLPFDKASHDASGVEQGTRILIFRRGEGIIGEGEVHGFFIQPKEWTSASKDDLPPSLANADYLLTVGMLYHRNDVISPETVRDTLDDPAFPQGDVWCTIGQDAYQALTDYP